MINAGLPCALGTPIPNCHHLEGRNTHGRMAEQVFCGTHLAPSCAACLAPETLNATGTREASGSCLGDCVQLPSKECVAIDPGSILEPPLTVPLQAWRFDPEEEVLRLYDAGSPLTTSALAMFIASALPGRNRARRCHQKRGSSSGGNNMERLGGDRLGKTCVDGMGLLQRPLLVELAASNSSVKEVFHLCDCRDAGAHDSRLRLQRGRSDARGKRLEFSVAGGSGNASTWTWPVVLLREPLESLANELIAHPELCSHVTTAVVANGGTRCSHAALTALSSSPVSQRFVRVMRCCSNPLSRGLIATLPASAATRHCISGGCDASTLYSLGRRALLRMPWFGATRAVWPSLLLLQRSLGIHPPQLSRETFEAIQRPNWPSAMGKALLGDMADQEGSAAGKSRHATALAAADVTIASPLSASQVRAWKLASAADFDLYDFALGVLAFRLRTNHLPPLPPLPELALPRTLRSTARFPASPLTLPTTLVQHTDVAREPHGRERSLPVRQNTSLGQVLARLHDLSQIKSSRVFDTARGAGRRMAAVPMPLRWNRSTDTIVFVHIAKCGGTSFNHRLMTLDVGLPCTCSPPWREMTPVRRSPRDTTQLGVHNGHVVVKPHRCTCARHWRDRDAIHAPYTWSALASSRLRPRQLLHWRFLQEQWLISPETTGWLGGVHAPVRVLQKYLMLASRLAESHALASGIHYATLLREPTRRFLSEFYETYDGWEAHHGTPPRLVRGSECSVRLAEPLRSRARRGIDNTSKALYDELFPHWLACPNNMAASRQTRALAFAALAPTGNAEKQLRATDGMLRGVVCGKLSRGDIDEGCSLRLARRALYQFTFLGLNEWRCASEKLFEAQFGLRFRNSLLSTVELGHSRSLAGTSSGHALGEGAHRVDQLQFESLDLASQRRVRILNRDDLQLYAEAESLFYRRLTSYGISRNVRCR